MNCCDSNTVNLWNLGSFALCFRDENPQELGWDAWVTTLLQLRYYNWVSWVFFPFAQESDFKMNKLQNVCLFYSRALEKAKKVPWSNLVEQFVEEEKN